MKYAIIYWSEQTERWCFWHHTKSLTEAFFCTPSRLRSASPRWWKMLCELYATEPGQPRDL